MDVLVFFFADLTVPAAICLAVCGWASCAAVLYLTHDAALADFDPRPALRRTVESGRFDPLLIARVSARHALADRLASSASRLTAPKGATR